jgi:hypothetical protein
MQTFANTAMKVFSKTGYDYGIKTLIFRVHDKLHTNSKKEHRTEKKEKRRGLYKNAKHFSFSLFSLCEKQTNKKCNFPYTCFIPGVKNGSGSLNLQYI